MRVKGFGAIGKLHLKPSKAIWICLVGGSIALGIAVGRGQGASQSPTPWTPQAEGSPTSPLPGTVAPAVAGAPATASASAPVEAAYTGDDPKKKAIADNSASLVKLANTLKVEVDKTSADTLSVTVIRRASEIEQLAHKMRAQ